jgi:hypothetical protein
MKPARKDWFKMLKIIKVSSKPVSHDVSKARNAGAVCPLSKSPVDELAGDAYHANDGYIYDKDMLTQWLSQSNLSPMTTLALATDQRVLVGNAIRAVKPKWKLDGARKQFALLYLANISAVTVLYGATFVPRIDAMISAGTFDAMVGASICVSLGLTILIVQSELNRPMDFDAANFQDGVGVRW